MLVFTSLRVVGEFQMKKIKEHNLENYFIYYIKDSREGNEKCIQVIELLSIDRKLVSFSSWVQ